MILNKRMRDTREDNDELQKDIAIILNITTQQYQLYESGQKKLPIDKLIIFCKHYNVSSDYILGLTDKYRELKK